VVHSGDTFSLGTHTITETATDHAGNPSTDSFTIKVQDTTPPTITIGTIAGDNIINAGEAGNAAGVTISGTAADSDSGVNGQTATIQIVNGSNAVVDSYTTTVSGGAWSVIVTKAQAQALADGSYTVTADVSDAAGNAATEATQAITVDKSAPTIGGAGNTITWQEGQSPVFIGVDTGLTLSDTDSSNIASATVSITGGTFLSGDALAAMTSGTNIGASYNASTGVLSLTGNDALAHYQQVLRSVNYTTSSNNPENWNGTSFLDPSRTINWMATDVAGNVSTTATSTVNVHAQAPMNFAFTADTATLAALYGGNNPSSLTKNTQVGTFAETGGASGDSYTFTLGGDGANSSSGLILSPASSANLFTNNANNVTSNENAGGAYQLTVTVNDTSNGTHTSALPFDVIVAGNDSNTITVGTIDGNTTTPTIVYGSKGETLDASTVTANMWFYGQGGKITMTGGTGVNRYLFGATSDSKQQSGNQDTISNFHTATSDVIDVTAISGITSAQGLISGSTQVAPHSIAWIQGTGGQAPNTFVYMNNTATAVNQSSAVMEIILSGFTASHLGSGNFSYSGHVLPAGIAGTPINLGLGGPSGIGATTTLTINAVPSDWSLNQGTSNGNSGWTVQTNDPSSLYVTTPSTFTGAMLLNVSESWTNADGSTGNASIADNVEAYPASPIFAVSGDDTLTGGQAGKNEFVFAQPIGNDTIYNFTTASDTIDLIGFGISGGFGALAIADDANGNAVATLSSGETITVKGVDASALSAADFVFDTEPVNKNSGTMTVGDGAILPLGGTIENTGVIGINSTGDESDLEIQVRGVTLEGGGQVTLSDNSQNVIFGGDASAVLNNIDNTISGAGQLGQGQLTLHNEGTIAATGTNALVIDTGTNAIVNTGLLKATGAGGLVVDSAVTGRGTAEISGSSRVEFAAASDAAVSFGAGAIGALKLDQSGAFSGTIAGFAQGDGIDLADIGFSAGATLGYAANAPGTGGTLTISDGVHTTNLALLGQYTAAGFQAAADQGGGTIITYTPTQTGTTDPTLLSNPQHTA
jgi:hypothetical protein